MKYKLEFYTEYRQFYINDKKSSSDTGSENFLTDTALDSRLAVGEGILGVGTECYGDVKCQVELLRQENNELDINNYDHIVEGGIMVSSGILQLLSCPTLNVELEVNVNPGNYRARIYSMNLRSLFDDSGDDYYRIEVWRSENMKRVVLKQFVY
jgi:hypothetical protein